MGIGVGLFLFAVGAILRFAVTPSQANGVNLGVVGVILMIVGALGMLLSLLFWSSIAPFGDRRDATLIEREHEHTHVV